MKASQPLNDLSVLLSRKQRGTNRGFSLHFSPTIAEKRPGTRSMNSSKLNELDAWQAARLMAKRELRAVDLLHACLDRIAERDDEVRAFAHLDRDHAVGRPLGRGPSLAFERTMDLRQACEMSTARNAIASSRGRTPSTMKIAARITL
jgi:hypothetical protein